MRILLTFIVVFFVTLINAQDLEYQRTYPPIDRVSQFISFTQISNGNYFVQEAYLTDQDEIGIQVIALTPKGDFIFSNEYAFDSLGTLGLLGDIQATEDGAAIFSVHEVTDVGAVSKKVIVKIDQFGAVEWAKTIGDVDDLVVPNATQFISDATGHYYFGNSARTNNQQEIFVSRIDTDGNWEWDEGIALTDGNTDFNTVFENAVLGADGNILLMGTLGVGSGPIVHHNMDVDGNPMWTRVYAPDIPISALDNIDCTAGPDSTYITVGRYNDATTFYTYVMKTDRFGNVIWTKNIDAANDSTVVFNYPVEAQYTTDGNVVVYHKFADFTNMNSGEMAFKLDTMGNVIWQKLYTQGNPFVLTSDADGNLIPITTGKMDATADGGFSYATLNDDGNTLLIKATLEGTARCEEDLIGDFISDVVFVQDTLNSDIRNIAVEDSTYVTVTDYEDLDIPIPSLLDTIFCPNDPIDVLLDATQEGAISYEWETGETTATYQATAEGSYRVTVTFDTDVCYTLCDTSTIELHTEPMVSIGVSDANLCDLGVLDLTAQAEFPSNVASYEWSTGDMTQSISVAQAGDYTVTIIDNCGLSATASVGISNSDFDIPFSFDIVPVALECDGGIPSLTLSIQNELNAIQSILWSTGETTPTIIVNSAGQYSVAVTDICGTVVDNTINVNPDFLALPYQFTIAADNVMCEGGMSTIAIFIDQEIAGTTLSQIWSTGETSDTIFVSEAGDYELTGTDECGTEYSQSINIDEDDFDTGLMLNFDLVKGDIECADGQGSISITVDSVSGGSLNDIANVEWSYNGTVIVSETGTELTGTLPGTYDVIVTDICGGTSEQSIELTPDDFMSIYNNIFTLFYWWDCAANTMTVTLDTNTVNAVHEYNWSNGETGPEIVVSPPGGTYSLTIVDECGGEATNSIEVQDDNFQLQYELGNALDCDPVGFNLNIFNQNTDITSIEWSTGETGTNIFVTESDEYTVTVTDLCGNTSEEKVDINVPELIELDVEFAPIDCTMADSTMITLCPTFSEDNVDIGAFEWTGPNGFASADSCVILTPDQIGDVNFKATIGCFGYEPEAPFDLRENDFRCSEKPCLEFPNIFFPNSKVNLGTEDMPITSPARDFGPWIKCGIDEITDYNLSVFNRWGKKVFESNDLDVEWDGRADNGNPHDAAVYMFYASWNNFDGEPETAQGDVTLVR